MKFLSPLLTIFFALMAVFFLEQPAAQAQGTAFSYNGVLSSSGGPANGTYDLTFTLYNTSANGAAMGGPITNAATSVNNGLFMVTLDFGPGIFTGTNYWLSIGVRTNGGGAFIILAPRQPVLPVPYAITAENASNLLGTLPASQISGFIANANLPASPVFGGTLSASFFSGNATSLSNIPAARLTGAIPSSALPGNLLTYGSPNAGFNNWLFVTNTGPGAADSDEMGVLGIMDTYYGAREIYNMSVNSAGGYWWSAAPQQYSDYTSTFNSGQAAGGPVGNSGLPQYIWNTHILSIPGDNRSSVGIITAFGTNADYGSIIEMLPRKSTYASINSGTYAHPIRLDGYGRVMIGNIPEAYHTLFYVANAYLDLWTGGNTDVPAMLFEQDGLTSTPVTGALERNNGLPYWTDSNLNRSQILLSGQSGDASALFNLNPAAIGAGCVTSAVQLTNSADSFTGTFSGNGGGLNNLNANSIVNGLTTNIVVTVPTGTLTLYFTNGVLRAAR